MPLQGKLFNFCQAGHIFADHIEFDIHFVAGKDSFYIRVFEGVGDDGDGEIFLFYVKEGEADAIEANGTFFDDEGGEFFGEGETEFPTACLFVSIQAGGGAIDVSLDDMAVETSIHCQASFEVDEVAGLPVAQIGLAKRFVNGGYLVDVFLYGLDGEAGAVMRDTLIYF
jgi:hypothetical protein